MDITSIEIVFRSLLYSNNILRHRRIHDHDHLGLCRTATRVPSHEYDHPTIFNKFGWIHDQPARSNALFSVMGVYIIEDAAIISAWLFHLWME